MRIHHNCGQSEKACCAFVFQEERLALENQVAELQAAALLMQEALDASKAEVASLTARAAKAEAWPGGCHGA